MARFLTIKERVEWERMGREPQVITDLNLDNCHSYVIDGLTNEYTALNTLSINYVLLHSFGDLPQLPSLTILSAHHNRIARNLHFLAERCPNLREIDLSNNHIEFVETLRPLIKLEKLEVLNLEHNPVNRPDFRSYIFDLLPTVKVLSGYMRPNACEPIQRTLLCKEPSPMRSVKATKEGARSILILLHDKQQLDIRDAENGLLLRVLELCSVASIYSLTLHVNTLYCNSVNGNVHVFDLSSGCLTLTLHCDKEVLCSRVFNDKFIFIGCSDGSINVFERRVDCRLQRLVGSEERGCAALEIVGNKIITAAQNLNKIKIQEIPRLYTLRREHFEDYSRSTASDLNATLLK